MIKRSTFLPFGKPSIGQLEIDSAIDCLKSGWIGTGPKVQQFENEFKEYVGAPYAAAMGSCTAALHLALQELNLPKGSEVIVPTMTFCATANAIVHAGYKPVFADCDPFTMNILVSDIERKLTKKTKALVIVHFAGRPCQMSEIMDLAKTHKLKVVEDCAHAIESTYEGQHCGTFGDFGCFSFYVTKNLTTVEGGMVISKNKASINRIKQAALHGMSSDAWARFSDTGYKHYKVYKPGFKYNMTDLQASIGLPQLWHLDEKWAKRQTLWDTYFTAFSLWDVPLYLPEPVSTNIQHSYHLFTCIVDIMRTSLGRDEVIEGLRKRNIGAGVHYTPVHLHPYYKKVCPAKKGEFRYSEWIGSNTFSLPLSPDMTINDVTDVTNALKSIFRRN